MTDQVRKSHFSRNGAGKLPSLRHAEKFIDLWRTIAAEVAREAHLGDTPAVPEKAAFTMQRLKPFLPYYFLSEWTDEGDLVNRLVGSGLDDELGSPHTGTSFLARYEGGQRRYFETFWQQLLSQPCGVITGRTLHMDDGRRLRMVGATLPLADRHGDIRYLCGIADIARDFQENETPMGGRRVYIDHVEYVDLGFGLPQDWPDPAEFNRLTDEIV